MHLEHHGTITSARRLMPRVDVPSRRRLLQALPLLAIAPACIRTAHARQSASDFAVHLGRQVITLARSGADDARLKKQFLELLTRNADIRAVARFALGKHRRRMPKNLMPEYYRLVLDYIAGLFVWYRKDLAADDIKALKAHTRGNWTTVETALVFATGDSRVLWRIHTAATPYRVGDVNIKGIWLSLRMRDKFVSILNRSGGDFDALLDYLRKNAA